MHRPRVGNVGGRLAYRLGELVFKRLRGPVKIIENNCLQDSNIVRKSCQIEGATPETKTKNQIKKMNTNNDWTSEDEINHLIEGIEIDYENLEEEA
jgi:hypothetical protein